jgi:NAD(P)-dependent dehydrogenase (short-subunit alcohol dehydrogenase family)
MPVAGEFTGRVALVTGGAGAGIGSATCRRLAELGASVMVLDEHARRAESTAAALVADHGVVARPVVADIADRAALDAALDEAEAELGPFDILVNNAAINIQGPIADIDVETFERVLSVDLIACYALCRRALRSMREIRCNAVAPGLVHSKWVEKQQERYEPFKDATPLRRHASPLDIANSVAFLCSDEAAHVTGAVLNVSGGWYLSQ